GDRRGLANSLFGFRQVDHGAGLHAARHNMARSDDLDRVRAPPQDVLGRLRFEPRDQAHDLAGADIKRTDERGSQWRQRPRLWGLAELEGDAHALPPFLAGGFLSLSLTTSERN